MASQEDINRMAFASLRRVDPSITAIVVSAKHVQLYNFDRGTNQWERMEVEGPMYVVSRSEAPTLQMIILNKSNDRNHTEDLLNRFTQELQRPYLLYRNNQGLVRGLWFPQQEECQAISTQITQAIAAHKSSMQQPAPPPRPASPPAPTESDSTHMAKLINKLSIGSQQQEQAHMHAQPPSNMPDMRQQQQGQRPPGPMPGHPDQPQGPPMGFGGMMPRMHQGAGPPMQQHHQQQHRPSDAPRPRINREVVRKTLLSLVARDDFLDMLAEELSRHV
ncbi:unnamed protein product [Pedinophyceae sp. YPF-701]|nr:unnamed protein product [Pedinophyceae sp. YPF-701]